MRWMNEHQPVLAQVGDDGGASLVAVLPGVTVFERFAVVGKLEFLAALDCRRAMLAFAQFGKVAQVAFAVGRAR